ncbi:MAG: hypothetical protein OIF34_03600, partial [Porticoccaceae bacterium]|nr:hypothetical protein [Porticoccaceae bacterium]
PPESVPEPPVPEPPVAEPPPQQAEPGDAEISEQALEQALQTDPAPEQPVSADPEPVTGGELAGEWIEICQQLQLGGVLGNTAANLVVTARNGNDFEFLLDQAYSSLYEESQQQRLADSLQAFCGSPCNVTIVVGAVDGETPRKHSERKRAERMASAVQAMRDDPLVKDLSEQLNGRLLEESVQPTNEV